MGSIERDGVPNESDGDVQHADPNDTSLPNNTVAPRGAEGVTPVRSASETDNLGTVDTHAPRVELGEQAGEVEPEPASAARLFGDRIDLARSYTAELARLGEELGLIGPLELGRIWSRHILNCALVAPLLRPGTTGDIGSGAGLPGIVLAIARPDVQFVLIEPMERRVDWLEQESRRLGLDNVRVIRARAEETKLDWPLDQVTARAVTALNKLIPATARLVKSGGEMVFMKGARVHDEVDAAAKAIRKARLSNVEILVLGEGVVPEVTRVFRATVD